MAGSRDCIDAVLSDARLESLPTSTNRRFDLESDRLNPVPVGLAERPWLTCGNGNIRPRIIPTSQVDFRTRPRVSLMCGKGQPKALGRITVAVSQEEHLQELSKGYRFDWKDPSHSVFEPKKGLSAQVVEEISALKDEPDWMRKYRLKALKHFDRRPMPWWGADLSGIDFDDIYYFIRSTEKQAQNWEDLPEDIKGTWDKLGIPEAEKKFLGGVSAQYESEVVYHKIKKELDDIGVLFTDMDSALRDHPDIVKEYFGTIIPPNDNKFAALNSAVWSGGSFIYVPPGVHVDIPLQAYFRINAEAMGQFERTLIIADEGSYVHYVEGCSAPIYTRDSLHSAVVEIIVKKNARVRYTTIQNWSNNVYNLVTKRAAAYEDSVMEWIDGNIGSKVTMKYPSIYLLGKGARGEVLSVAFAGEGQHTDAGGKAIHAAPYTTSVINSKSVSKGGGRTGYRGLVRVEPGADHAKSMVRCDALILDEISRSDTYPYVEVEEQTAQLGHEASVARIGEDQLFYLMSRGLTEAEASAMIVNGFIEPITRELPMEYAVELNRLIELQMEGAIG
jgi:Fe-S cluster assembly protein SufB